MTWFLWTCFAVIAGMLGRYAVLEQRTRAAWRRTELRPDLAPEHYRENQIPTFTEVTVRTRAPRIVRMAAASAQLFGITFVPGLVFALIGMLVYGIGLLGIPGLVVAFTQFSAASALLRRSPDAPVRARKLARLSTILNLVILLGGGAVLVPLVAGECISGTEPSPVIDLVPSLLPLLAWACLSLGQAALLRSAATAVEDDLRAVAG